MAEWFSIEVFNGSSSARAWAEAYGDALVQAGLQGGASEWAWHHDVWGSILEIELPDEAAWLRFLETVAVRAALDAVPDPVNGVITYRGRGGGSASGLPRRPRPLAGAGAAALPIPVEEPWFELSEIATLAGAGTGERALFLRAG
ncbi:MAG: hypothetical protein ACRDYD_03745 [Acidimicrobiales bacterium]